MATFGWLVLRRVDFGTAESGVLICYLWNGIGIRSEKGMVPAIPPRILAMRILMATVAALALVFCGDYLFVRIRLHHPKPADPFETLKSLRVLAIAEKNGKTEYELDAQNPEQVVTCVHALFPHSGYSPCWYVKPRINQPIPM
jgi:hypothetical protein